MNLDQYDFSDAWLLDLSVSASRIVLLVEVRDLEQSLKKDERTYRKLRFIFEALNTYNINVYSPGVSGFDEDICSVHTWTLEGFKDKNRLQVELEYGRIEICAERTEIEIAVVA